MSAGRSDTSSKRKRSTPQKFKSRKLFPSSRHDLLEQPEFSRAKEGGSQESQLSKLPVTMQNKENMPEKCPNGSVTPSRGRGRPKGSKNKTFPTLPTKVYAVREGKSPVYIKAEGDDFSDSPPRTVTPHRGRGRPRGSTKVKIIGDDVPKRSRGRPKGSKNKKPSKAALLKMLTSGEKIGRGRPRKLPYSNESGGTPKRGRGRPKGSLNKVSSAKRLSITSGSLEVKKRGRPRKIMLHHPTTIMVLAPKRPRGRPRKKAYTAVPSHPSDHELSVISDNFVVKKRGRPKKIILHPTLMALTPKRPRGRPRKMASFQTVEIIEHEVKSSESNTEDEEDIDSEEDDRDRDHDHNQEHDQDHEHDHDNDNDNEDDDDK